ncbi:MAG: riboflavin biosynthesis protein RibF [Prevotellaceae bacterium]|jgi:riboflavin kinase/FMN adenylyltransferase|nr:riboflavin biosynthesis protein RibF [Prevotellaceae bacterium]
MQLIDFYHNTTPLPNTVATIGFFDGVHCGHRFLFDNFKNIATEKNLKTLVVTFREHPSKVLQLSTEKKLLTTFVEKMELLGKAGIDFCLVIDFSEAIANLSAADFIQLLHQQFAVNTLLVGYDNRFGHSRLERFEDYRNIGAQIGVEVLNADAFILGKGLEISSSKIRHLLQNGNVETANQLLGYRYSFDGKVVHGDELGRQIGFPTANLQLVDAEKILPLQGSFAVQVQVDGQARRGMMNIGYKPTVKQGLAKTIEVNIFDFDADIYDQTISVTLLKKLRDEQKFSSLAALKAQLEQDRENAKPPKSPIGDFGGVQNRKFIK